MRKLKTLLTSLLVLLVLSANAQTFDEYVAKQKQAFDEFHQKAEDDYKAYRDKVNAEFAEMMSKSWSEFGAEAPIPQPKLPEPPEPIIAEPEEVPAPVVRLPVSEIVKPSTPLLNVDPPKPLIPMPLQLPPPAVKCSFAFDYYGTSCGIDINDSHKIQLTSVDELAVSKCWKKLSGENFDPLVTGCLEWKERLDLSDWGYVRFVEKMTNSLYGEPNTNEAKVVQFYLLIQSGYEARIARNAESLYLLLPFESEVYEYPYITIDHNKYYIISSQSAKNRSYVVFNQKFPQEKRLSLLIHKEPNLELSDNTRTLTSKRYPEIVSEVRVNENLINFYNEFPRNNGWDLYAYASLSSDVKSTLYPVLEDGIADKSDLQKVERLLNFVQTAFEYKTDDVQFGQERPFFADETIFYPYCDCEDRAILFSVLVRDLVGLDVVLVNYPGHLAAAVNFNTTVKGDYLNIDGKKFTVCDPTYIGASVGRSMPDYKNSEAKIIKL